MIKLCISGCKGKMGGRIIALAKQDAQLKIVGEFDIGQDPEGFIKQCDCLVEFTTPEATMQHLLLCEKYKKAIVIGTTGISEAQRDKIKEAARRIPVVFSANMSIGVNVLFNLAESASKALGIGYSVRIKEAHHIHKKDSPSGTAKELARIVKEAKGGTDIPIDSLREGEIVGDHTVTFESPLDTIELSHSAKTRDIFVKGALEAAKFIVGKPVKLYTMKEVLGI